MVLTEVGEQSPYYGALRVFKEMGVDVVLRFQPDKLDAVFARLEKIRPGAVVVVIKPQSLDVHFHFDFLEQASRLDADPFVDFTFGYITGGTGKEATAFASGIARARKQKISRRILEFGPSARPAGVRGPVPVREVTDSSGTYKRTRSCSRMFSQRIGRPSLVNLTAYIQALMVYRVTPSEASRRSTSPDSRQLRSSPLGRQSGGDGVYGAGGSGKPATRCNTVINMSRPSPAQLTSILDAAASGDRAAGDSVLSLIYGELHQLAKGQMRREAAGHTLQATALVHEAYMRLLGGDELKWANRAHFFGAAAQAMRRILIDRARHYRAEKHGGGRARVTLTKIEPEAEETEVDLITLDEKLTKLEETDPRMARVVTLRFFAGLSVEETAEALEISPRTVKREWSVARAWLYREMGGEE